MSDAWREQAPEPGEPRAFEFPDVHSATLRNGMRVVHARHGRMPVVSAHVVIDAGAAAEPASRGGLAQLTASALHAGTNERDSNQLAWDLELLGVQLNTDVTWDAIEASITPPAAQLADALAVLADVVRNAAFPDGEVGRLREEQLAEILQRMKEPRALANDVVGRCFYAPDAPYARPLIGTTESVGAITPSDLRAFHRDRFTPSSCTLVLVGDIDADSATALAERCFGDWTGTPAPLPDLIVRPRHEGPSVHIVDRIGAVQSELRIGHIGVPRSHPDYFPLIVMNTIFGGAFTSRLNMNLRETHGFTYGVRSQYTLRRGPGPFLVSTAVGTDVTVRAVEEVLKESERLRSEGVSDEELTNARDYLIGILPLQMQTTGQLASALAELVTYGLPLDYYDNYRDRIAAVTAEDIRRVAREHMRPETFAIVVVGDAASVREGIEGLKHGTVYEVKPNGGTA
ncbi:MAG: insulinase family protein [Candidatus Cloacimonetes bacterium]|nr:insulinase family protein [Candidatus Cloacimonadota bacterium]